MLDRDVEVLAAREPTDDIRGQRIETVLRCWPVAGLSLLVLALLFGVLMATSQ